MTTTDAISLCSMTFWTVVVASFNAVKPLLLSLGGTLFWAGVKDSCNAITPLLLYPRVSFFGHGLKILTTHNTDLAVNQRNLTPDRY